MPVIHSPAILYPHVSSLIFCIAQQSLAGQNLLFVEVSHLARHTTVRRITGRVIRPT